MSADDIRFLFDYSYAATARILAAAGQLEPGAFVGPAPVRGCASLREVLVHTLDAERGWRTRAPGGTTRRTSTRRRFPTSPRWPMRGVPTRC